MAGGAGSWARVRLQLRMVVDLLGGRMAGPVDNGPGALQAQRPPGDKTDGPADSV